MEHRKRSAYNLICSGLGQVVTIAIGLLLPRLYITGYGSETNGLLTSVNQFLVYLGLFEAGVGGAALQALYGPVAREDRSGISRILSATGRFYRRMGVLYLVSLAAFSFAYPLIARSELPRGTVAGAALLSGLGTALLFFFHGKYRVLLEAEGKNYVLTNLATVTNVLTGLSKVVLARFGAPVLAILAAGFAMQCIPAVYIHLYVRRGYGWIDPGAVPDTGAIEQKSSVLVHEVSGMIFQNTDVLLLTVFCGLKVVSVYSVYRLVITQIENALSAFSGSVSFSLGQTFQTDRVAYARRIDRFESLFSALAGGTFAAVLPLLLPFVRLYTRGVTDASYADGRYAVLFVSGALLSAARRPMQQTIHYAGHYRQTLSRTIAESAVNLGVSLLLVRRFGIAGVLLGTVAALLYRTADIWVYSNRRILGRSWRRTARIHLVTFAAFLLLQAAFRAAPVPVSYPKLLLAAVWDGIAAVAVCLGAQCLFFPDTAAFLREEAFRLAARLRAGRR